MILIKTYRILRKISEELINFDVFLMHGVALAIDGEAYLFTAPSRTGKSTHAELWVERCPEAFIINGDKPFIRVSEGQPPLVCGSPWAGKENLFTNIMVPLKAIVLMERAEENHIMCIPFAKAFPTLLQQTYHPKDAAKMQKTLSLMQRLNPAVSFWHFQCNNYKNDCFDVAYRALVEGNP